MIRNVYETFMIRNVFVVVVEILRVYAKDLNKKVGFVVTNSLLVVVVVDVIFVNKSSETY